MQLTPQQRLILANQYRILEALYPDEADSYSRMREALERGYTVAWDFPFIEGEMSEEDCREVHNILLMFQHINDAVKQGQAPDGVPEWTLKFVGFDGNNEGEQLGYLRYLIEDGRFTDVASESVNSHGPTLDMYRRMLEAWQESKKTHTLTTEDLKRIADVQIHPSSR